MRAEASPAEACELPAAHEAPARRVRAAVWQPGCLAAAQPIDAGNVGMRLLAKMGWKEGSGAPRPLSLRIVSVTKLVHGQASGVRRGYSILQRSHGHP